MHKAPKQKDGLFKKSVFLFILSSSGRILEFLETPLDTEIQQFS